MLRLIYLGLVCLLPVAAAASAAPMYHLTTLATVDGTNGYNLYAGLIADAAGNLYGTTRNGGDLTLNGGFGYGTVFEVAAGTHALSTLATFDGTNGAIPIAGLIADASGNLFGTTQLGGPNNKGTVFKLSALTHALSTLATFDGTNGSQPVAGLLADASGNLYGTTNRGGTNDKGTVFELAGFTHVLSTLVTFNGTNGANPIAGLIADGDGNLYGTTYQGGANNRGTVFELAAVTHALSTLATFNGTNGSNPLGAGLLADASGNLYGTTRAGGDLTLGGGFGYGTVFEVTAGTHTLSTLATFNGANGYQPYAGLIADAIGNFYGTTLGGGANGLGTVFELSPVPEPSTFVLAALGTFGLLISRWRRFRFAPRLSVVVTLAACAAIQQAPGIAHAATVRTVALSGQQAPGTPNGVDFGVSPIVFVFSAPVLNDAGQTAFRATLTGSGVDSTNNAGMWSEGTGSLALVARAGSQAADTPIGVNYSSIDAFSPVLNDSGRTAFQARLTDGGSGIWSEGSGSVALVARSGDQAAGTPSGVSYSFFVTETRLLNNAGQIAFRTGLTGSGVDSTNEQGIWSEGTGSLALVARSGDHAPGTPSGVNFGYYSGSPFGLAVLNDAGQTAFSAYLTGSGVDLSNQQGIWSKRSGSLALVARAGSQAPGTPSGVNYTGFQSPALNNTGQTAFLAFVGGSGVDSTNDRGMWSEGSGSLALVARSGDHAPGTPSGVNYWTFFSSPVLNDAGQIAFSAYLTGSGVNSADDLGVWSEGSGSLALVARDGSHAPGTPNGVNYSFQSSVSPALNNAGQTAFFSGLTGSGVDSTNDRGIWATDRTGAVQLIARSGDLLEVAPGDFRTISFLAFVLESGNSDGRRSGFNNLGQLAFRARFTDSTEGIFVSNRVAVPEPSCLALASLGVLGLVVRRVRPNSARLPRVRVSRIV